MVGITDTIMSFIEKEYHKSIEELKKLDKRSILQINYDKINNYFIKERNTGFFEINFQSLLDYAERVLNENRDNKSWISLKIVDIPCNILLSDLDADNNGDFISTKAMIKNITPIMVRPDTVVYECNKCMRVYTTQIAPNSPVALNTYCSECGGKSFRLLTDESTYKNKRYVKLEEPLELRKGGSTREFKAYMEDYLASPEHNLKAGDVCDISGTFEIHKRKKGKSNDEFEFIIRLHNIMPVDDNFEDTRISEDDKAKIVKLSQETDIFDKLVNTLAPTVHGYDTVKKGILLQLFEGARPKTDSFKHNNIDRWTIHILLIGDPGIGKSQILESVNKNAPKCINISGTGASQAGITTTAVKDELTGTWAMEAGAVVLADTGLLTIDEFDKLTANTQKSLNEPMEQLAVSSAKAGLVQTMSARTSILAAANPKYSKFNKYKLLKEQINMPDSTLSRFDLVFVLEDKVSKELDNDLATNLLNNNVIKSDNLIDEELFKKYVTYAKSECFPTLNEEAKQLLIDFYVETRQTAVSNEDGKPITARDLKAIERLSVARAKCELRDIVTLEDSLEAILIYKEALSSLGLNPETAGVLQGIKSNKELKDITECEKVIKRFIELYGDNLSSESIDEIIEEVGCDINVYNEAYNNVVIK